MAPHPLPIKERIEQHIISKENCWITDYKCNPNNKQQINIKGKNFILSRIAYETYKGEIPKNLCVYNSCDSLNCINPEHLYLGRKAEGGRNREKRNRQAKGSKIGTSKLTEVQVVEIRDLLLKGELAFKEICKMFSVSETTIRRINEGKDWTHIEGIGSRIRPKKKKKRKIQLKQANG